MERGRGMCCRRCGYEVVDAQVGKCAECGRAVGGKSSLISIASYRRRRVLRVAGSWAILLAIVGCIAFAAIMPVKQRVRWLPQWALVDAMCDATISNRDAYTAEFERRYALSVSISLDAPFYKFQGLHDRSIHKIIDFIVLESQPLTVSEISDAAFLEGMLFEMQSVSQRDLEFLVERVQRAGPTAIFEVRIASAFGKDLPESSVTTVFSQLERGLDHREDLVTGAFHGLAFGSRPIEQVPESLLASACEHLSRSKFAAWALIAFRGMKSHTHLIVPHVLGNGDSTEIEWADAFTTLAHAEDASRDELFVRLMLEGSPAVRERMILLCRIMLRFRHDRASAFLPTLLRIAGEEPSRVSVAAWAALLDHGEHRHDAIGQLRTIAASEVQGVWEMARYELSGEGVKME